MKTNHIRRLSAVLTVLALLCAMAAPAAAADDGAIHIRSQEDWKAFAENCRLDTWSQGKTVVLDQDLDLIGAPSVPTFGGTFDGGGHTLRGLFLTGEGGSQGLFRYVQEGAVVRNLSVTGTVAPQGSWRSAGAIAGANRGTLSNCAFTGTVSGKQAVGGIAGINEASGNIVDCTASGSVVGEHSTGGIAGENYGTILQCVNRAKVNTREEAASPQLGAINWGDLNSTENLPACIDTGGIAGYSKGAVQGCVNYASVGYPHTGYNVGGIAGRQSGYLDGCVNHGLIQGRKEIGGIVGQMEPYMVLRYQEDALQKLLGELDALSALLSGTISDLDASRRELSGTFRSIADFAASAHTEAGALLNDVADLGDGTVDTANDFLARISRVVDRSAGPAADLEDSADQLSRAFSRLERALKKLESDSGTGMPEEVNAARETLQKALDGAGDAAAEVLRALAALKDALGDPDAAKAALERLGTALAALKTAAGGFQAALDQLETAVGGLLSGLNGLPDVSREVRSALDAFSTGADALSHAAGRLEDILKDLSREPVLEFPRLDSDFYDRQDRLEASLDGLIDQLNVLNGQVEQSGSTLSGNAQAVLAQFRAITGVLRESQDSRSAEHVVDVSGEVPAAPAWGKVSGCANHAAVEGDVNIGGIAGSMAIEYDFDPEDDIASQGSASLNFQYLTQAVISGSVSTGAVTARRDCAGGVVGYMAFGLVAGCQGYGSVESSGGQYVGGVAGRSDSVIRDSWAKCSLSGVGYVGGVAGRGRDISGCRTLVRAEDGPCVGAVAGEAGGELRENYFVSQTLGGVDGVSYAAQAQPVEYEAFLQLPEVPEAFRTFLLTFTADGETVGTVPFSYGGALSSQQLPQVPPKDGFYGAWNEFDRERLFFDAEIEAVYTPWLSAVASQDGSVLAEGEFVPGTALEALSASPGQWSVSISGDRPFTALRLALPEDAGRQRAQYLTERGVWSDLPASREGSFLRVELTGRSAVVRLLDAPPPAGLWLSLLGGAAVLAVLLIRAGQIRRAKRAAAQKPREEIKA